MALEDRLKMHNKCAVTVKQVGPHWGLYCDNPKCKRTGVWIQWINQRAFKGILQH